MSIAFRAGTTGAHGASRTDTVLSAPAGLTDFDIMLAGVILVTGSTTPTPSPPAGWTQIGTIQSTNFGGFPTKFGKWWKRASGESGSYTFSHSTADCQGWIGAYSGCIRTGTPIGTPAENSGNSQTNTFTGVTTGAANSWIVGMGHDWQWGGSLTPPGGMTERLDDYFYVADQLIASPGATGNKTMTNSNSSSSEPFITNLFELIVEPDPRRIAPTYNNRAVMRAANWQAPMFLRKPSILMPARRLVPGYSLLAA